MNDNQESKDFLFKIILILFGVTIISGGIVWLLNRPTSVATPNNEASNCPGIDGTNRFSALKEQRSLGEQVLVKLENNDAKVAGSRAFESCDFEQAIANFQEWLNLRENQSDPEALIYLNNARSAETENQTVKIVASVPIGSNLGVAQEILRGVAHAQKDINEEGGINGKSLVVEIANDNNDPTSVTDLAQEFIDDGTIMAVVGHNSSKTSRFAAEQYEGGKLVMVSPTSSADNAFLEYSDYIFRTIPRVSLYAKSLADRIYDPKKNGALLEKIAICYDSEDTDSLSFKDDFENSISQLNSENPGESPAQVVYTDCDLSLEDFNPQEIIEEIKSQEADSLVLIASVKTIDKAAQIAKAQGEDKLPLFGSTSLGTRKTLKIGQEGVEGMVLSIPWHPDAVEDGNSFPSNAYELWGGPVNWRTALAYDATKVIIEGLKESETREGLQKALKEPGFSVDGATGIVTFNERGDRQQLLQELVIIEAGSSNETGYGFKLSNEN